MSCFRWWGLPAWVLCLPALALTSGAGRAADEPPPPPDSKAVDAVIHKALRDVINEGADMYNAQGRYQNGERDYAGCYHLYEGALMGLKPLLSAHPDLQKAIDEGLDNARTTPRVEMRAFVLREVIDKIRDASGGKPVAPPPVEATFKGKVTKVEADKITVKPTDGASRDFIIPAAAKVMIDGKEGKAADIKSDALVTISLQGDVVAKVEATAPAAVPPPPPAETHIRGKVTKVEADKITVKPETGDAIDFTIPKTARVTIDGKEGKAADIKADSTAAVTLQNDLVTKVEIKGPAAPPPPPPPPAERTFTGKVVRADKEGLLLRGDDGKDKPVLVPDTAKILIDGKDGKLEDIKKDSTATVTSKGDEVVKVEAKGPAAPPSPETLWDRLGGETAVAKVVDDFVNTAGKDPKVNFWRDPTFTPSKEQVAALKKSLVEYVSSVSGGPLKYTGKDMKAAHKGMKITDDEFDAAAADLKAALEKNGVKADDAKAVLTAVEGTRNDVVEKASEDKPKPPDEKKADDKPAETGSVSGKVTYKGQPLPGGTVRLIGADGKINSAALTADGTYQLEGLKAGEYAVAVETESVKKNPAAYKEIPKKFADPGTTPLKVIVVKGKQVADLDLND